MLLLQGKYTVYTIYCFFYLKRFNLKVIRAFNTLDSNFSMNTEIGMIQAFQIPPQVNQIQPL